MGKIGIIITNLGLGGAERIATMQADFLQTHGHDVSLITLQETEDHYHPSRAVQRVRMQRDNALKLYSRINDLGVDLVIDHIHWSEHHYAFFELLAKKKKKFIIIDHNSYFYPLFFDYRVSLFFRRSNIYRLADAVTTLNRHTCAMFRLELDNAIVVHNPLSYESNRLSELSGETVIAVANWRRAEKRLWCVMKTFSLVLNERPKAKLLLVGSYDQVVYELCAKYNIPTQAVEAVGRQELVESYFLRSSAILLTSEVEGFGLVLTEAAMHGMPRVIMNVPGLEDVVNDGEDGFIVPDGDCQAAADKLSILLADPKLRQTMGKNARDNSAQFSLEIIGRRWEWLVEEVLNYDTSTRTQHFAADCARMGVDKISSAAMLHEFNRQLFTLAAKKAGITKEEVSDRKTIRLALMNSRKSLINDPIGKIFSLPMLFWQQLKSRVIAWKISNSGLFDANWYLEQNPDVADARKDPLRHYLSYGIWEGRNPCKNFNSWDYLFQHPDVAASGMEPFFHYVQHGQTEGRLLIDFSENNEVSDHEPLMSKKNNAPSLDAWIESYLAFSPKGDHEVVILHPAWRGIYSSAIQFAQSEQLLFIEDNINQSSASMIAAALSEAGIKIVLFQGFALSWRHLVQEFKKCVKKIRLYCIFHGSFYQMGLEYDRRQLSSILGMQKLGLLDRIGLVKFGMAETLEAAGYRTGFVMNYTNKIPHGPAPYLPNNLLKIGIWGREWDSRKPLYPSLAALCHCNNVKPYIYGGKSVSRELLSSLNLSGEVRSEVPQSKMTRALQEMYINMYVTMSECAPMLPLESLSVGVPCLFSYNNHYFEDHPYLHKMLVVSQPDSEYAIVKKLKAAIDQRDEIIDAYIQYAPGYNERAKKSYSEYLGR